MNYLYQPNSKANDKALNGVELSLKEFMQTWPIPVSILAERLRKRGFEITAVDLTKLIKRPRRGDKKKSEYVQRILLVELRGDINNTLDRRYYGEVSA